VRRLLLISSSAVHGSGYLDYCISPVRDFFAAARTVLFVPFALQDRDAYARTVRDRLAREALAVESLHQVADPVAAVNQAKAIFVGGGNTFRLLNTLYEMNLMDPLRRRVLQGTPYMGTSAGSNLACPTIMTTNDMPIVQPPSFKALDLVPFQLNPHYLDPDPGSQHKGETRETRLKEYHEMNRAPVVGLREGAMLQVEGDRMVLKGTSGARIFFKDKPAVEQADGDDLSDLLKSPSPD
jgi:dipeptidase E